MRWTEKAKHAVLIDMISVAARLSFTLCGRYNCEDDRENPKRTITFLPLAASLIRRRDRVFDRLHNERLQTGLPGCYDCARIVYRTVVCCPIDSPS